MPPLIREFRIRTGQSAPGGKGEMPRCILESLAVATALVVPVVRPGTDFWESPR